MVPTMGHSGKDNATETVKRSVVARGLGKRGRETGGDRRAGERREGGKEGGRERRAQGNFGPVKLFWMIL